MNAEKTTADIQLLQNPATSALKFNFQSSANQVNTLNVYTINGVRLLTKTVSMQKGFNTVSIDLNNIMQGTYILELTSGSQRSSTKFFKQ